ncbi:MAG TPA: hypothetical protein PLM07_17255 [Candidatus Rifleibacterium sp.]|nr:hypothetical protein [Candidatus Rifleibacterium sp.]HPT47629.1 hypothetical protein [Candidatus Rifleibacterium sp.]
MPKKILLTALLFAIFASPNLLRAQASTSENLVASASAATAIDESREPADTFKLSIDGNEYQIVPEKSLEVTCKGEKLPVLLTVEPLKNFNYGGIELKYPRNYTFEADLSEKEVSLWSLSGNQFVLMIQKYPAEMNHQIMASMLLPRFGEKNSSLEPCRAELNGSETAGTRLITTIGDSTITQEIYSFKVEGGSLLLILQDTIGSKGEKSEEGAKFRELLKTTLKFAAAG